MEDHTIGCADAGRTTKIKNVFMRNMAKKIITTIIHLSN